MSAPFTINQDDRIFIDRLRGLSIIRVVLVHLGLSWFYPPYSQFVLVFLPILFFVSGAVSFPIFLRAQSSFHYAVKRLSSIIIPYYVIASLIVICLLFLLSNYYLTGEAIIRWLLVSPTPDMTPFSLGQLWFLRALLVISIISVPIYMLAQKNVNYLLAPIAVSIVIAYYQAYHDVYKYIYIYFFNLYQPIVNAGFFFLGSYYYANKKTIGLKTVLSMFFASVAVALFSFLDADLTINMADHSFAPNLYYIGLSFAAIFLVILSQPIIQRLFYNLKSFDLLVLLYSKHAYSVFIVHSAMIYLSEIMFGWKNVMDKPGVAFAKIIFVLIGSLIISVPLTAITRVASKRLVNVLYGK